MRRSFPALAALLLAAGCADDAPDASVDAGAPGTDTGADPGIDAAADAGVDTDPGDTGVVDVAGLNVPASLVACSGATTGTWVLSEFRMLRIADDGTLEGFDLDGRTSRPGDERGCGHGDRMAPDGSTGVDNQFASLVPVIESFGGGASLENGIANAVRDGDLLYVLDLPHTGATCDGLTIGRAVGAPLLNALGGVVPHQTLVRDAEAPLTQGTCVANADCIWFAQGDQFPLQLAFLGTPVSLELVDWMARLQIEDDGTIEGMIGGAVPIEVIEGVASILGGADAPLRDAILAVVPSTTDLQPADDGTCGAMSVAFGFRAVPAFATEP